MKHFIQYPSQEFLTKNFIYDNGKLLKRETMKEPPKTYNGYIRYKIDGKYYYAHKLIYIYFNGKPPKNHIIHHIDGNTTNNKISNLCCITQQQNVKLAKRKNKK